jgi:hypothetical protein
MATLHATFTFGCWSFRPPFVLTFNFPDHKSATFLVWQKWNKDKSTPLANVVALSNLFHSRILIREGEETERERERERERKKERERHRVKLLPFEIVSYLCDLRADLTAIGHEGSVGLSVCKVHISATRWRLFTLTAVALRFCRDTEKTPSSGGNKRRATAKSLNDSP